ncbi:MAG: hypothetical protein K8R02_03375 [Anaerohalosphaeraceae bacterium]|nr:hypothetical protein [Anaerohalosphaeraceae bacterium]
MQKKLTTDFTNYADFKKVKNKNWIPAFAGMTNEIVIRVALIIAFERQVENFCCPARKTNQLEP